MFSEIWQSCLCSPWSAFFFSFLIPSTLSPKHFTLKSYVTLTKGPSACSVLGLMDSDLIPLCSYYPFLHFLTAAFVKLLARDSKMSNPSKSILVAIAATVLIVVLTWSAMQVKSHKMPTTETGSAANNKIFFVMRKFCCTLCVTAWRTDVAPLFPV